MKKLFRRLLPLTLALAMLLSMSAFAADVVDTDAKGNTITVDGGLAGYVTAVFDDKNEDIMLVTYTGGMLVEGEQYLILMYTGSTIEENSIKYINQTAAKKNDANELYIDFEVYPSDFMSGTILIAGMDKDTKEATSIVAAIIEAKYLLGDVNSDTYVDLFDAVAIVQYYIGALKLEPHQVAVADVDGEVGVDLFDAVRIVQYFIGIYDHLG